MRVNTFAQAATLTLLFLTAAVAQIGRPHDVVPLRHWVAPLYWQPTQAEAAASDPAAQPHLAGVLEPQAQIPANSLVFVGMTPCRILDTRSTSGFTGAFGPPSLAGGASRSFPIQSSTTCAVPSIAKAYSLNVTVVPLGPLGFLTVYPTGATRPNASTLNDDQGVILANAAIVPAGTPNGSIDVFANNPTNVIIDINGYYASQSGITLAQGSAGAPALSFASDAGTGIFSSGAGILNLSTSGVNRLNVDSTGIIVAGNVKMTGMSNGVVFPDSTKQTTAAPGGLTHSDLNSGDIGNYTIVDCSAYNGDGNLAHSHSITIAANEQVVINASYAVGSTAGANSLRVYACHQKDGGAWVLHGSGQWGLAVGANQRMAAAMNHGFTGLTAGSYVFGVCGCRSFGSTSWDSNDYFAITTLVFNSTGVTITAAEPPGSLRGRLGKTENGGNF